MQITRTISGRIARFTTPHGFAEWPWDDYYSEAQMKALSEQEWHAIATEVLSDEGVIAWSELLDTWVGTDQQWELEAEAEQEARWEAEHIRQESRTDIFI